MNSKNIARKIIELKEADLQLRNRLIEERKLGEGYNVEMESLHNKNAKTLDKIIDNIGYPTTEKVGKEACEAAWLVIQHSIGQPDFMKKCLLLLENAVAEKKANPVNLAYLADRIATFEGKMQLYGTQFDWDKNGELTPLPYDDLLKVNHRRKSFGLNSLEEQTQIMRRRVESENLSAPKDMDERKQRYDHWRRKVGWIE